ncbi:hypothetical protein F4814DRAFT_401423 [Daldinia grandis]|nr:hypothetical protein F4814DRAFT_401423 [Daldinia grandis]
MGQMGWQYWSPLILGPPLLFVLCISANGSCDGWIPYQGRLLERGPVSVRFAQTGSHLYHLYHLYHLCLGYLAARRILHGRIAGQSVLTLRA